MNNERKNNKEKYLKFGCIFQMRSSLFIMLSLFIIQYSLFITPLAAMTEIRDTEIENVLGDYMRPIAEAAEIKTEHVRVRLIADRAFNAFVMGGGDVFLFTGLIKAVDNPAEIQAIFAHELGHTDLGHMITMRMKQRNETTRTLIMQALGVGLMAANPQAGMGIMMGGAGMGHQGMLAFSREEERAADEYAVRLMREADIPISALLTVFEKMQNAYRERRINPNAITHPLTEERIRNIRLHIDEDDDRVAEPCVRLTMVQAKLIGYLDPPERILILFPESNTGDPAMYARTIKHMRLGNTDTARIGVNELIRRHPRNPYFRELLGDIEFRAGNFDASIAAYEAALARIDSAPQMELAMAFVLANRDAEGDRQRAARMALSSMLSERRPMAWLVLARARPEKHDYYMAEFHLMRRDNRRATEFAQRALRTLPAGSPEAIKAQDIIDTARQRRR